MSTSISKPILEIKNLDLIFKTDMHRPWTWRDVFTRAAQDPVGALLAEKERHHVLKNISLKLSVGDRVALIGVNGTGKTTLCRCIAGIYYPTRGKILTRGKVRAVFDTAIGVLPELTGRENAQLLAEFIYPDHPEKHASLITDALEFSELGKFLDVPYRLYSNGMQARLCLSLISCLPSDLLILDEVFEGADVFFKEKIAQRILKMIENSGAAIFVSHSPDQIHRVCNRLILLKNGQIAYDGDVEKGLQVYLNEKHSN